VQGGWREALHREVVRQRGREDSGGEAHREEEEDEHWVRLLAERSWSSSAARRRCQRGESQSTDK
jgi:hypothetical protein